MKSFARKRRTLTESVPPPVGVAYGTQAWVFLVAVERAGYEASLT
jgi:hypothetical protein